MKKRKAIFGPPGVGKSTLVKLALKKGIKARDFESLPEDKRLELAYEIFKNEINGIVLYNAANLQPEDLPADIEAILLLPPEKVYIERLHQRDKLQPGKSNQDGKMHYSGFLKGKDRFDRTIAEATSPEEILSIIMG